MWVAETVFGTICDYMIPEIAIDAIKDIVHPVIWKPEARMPLKNMN